MKISNLLRCTALAIVLVTGSTSVSHAQDFPAAYETKVGPRDVLEIRVVQDDKFSTRATVGEDGIITMPIAGKVAVGGLTSREIEQRIKVLLESKFLNQADVS